MKRYNLKFWRMKRGLTQADVAGKLGLSTGHYKSLENGVFEPTQKTLDKFGEVFELSDGDVKALFK